MVKAEHIATSPPGQYTDVHKSIGIRAVGALAMRPESPPPPGGCSLVNEERRERSPSNDHHFCLYHPNQRMHNGALSCHGLTSFPWRIWIFNSPAEGTYRTQQLTHPEDGQRHVHVVIFGPSWEAVIVVKNIFLKSKLSRVQLLHTTVRRVAPSATHAAILSGVHTWTQRKSSDLLNCSLTGLTAHCTQNENKQPYYSLAQSYMDEGICSSVRCYMFWHRWCAHWISKWSQSTKGPW